MQVKCEKCGARISISEYDYKTGKYPRLCPKCKLIPKRGTREVITDIKENEKKTFKIIDKEVKKTADGNDLS